MEDTNNTRLAKKALAIDFPDQTDIRVALAEEQDREGSTACTFEVNTPATFYQGVVYLEPSGNCSVEVSFEFNRKYYKKDKVARKGTIGIKKGTTPRCLVTVKKHT